MGISRGVLLAGLFPLTAMLACARTSGQQELEQQLTCDGGRTLAAVFDDGADTATLIEGEARRVLVRLPSGSGARYGSDGIEFWIKGMEATLTEGEARVACRFAG
jgi:membrane-bound inhibitor of C-type lysozyme